MLRWFVTLIQPHFAKRSSARSKVSYAQWLCFKLHDFTCSNFISFKYRHGEVQQEKEDSIGELDRNMQSLAECYNKKRSSGSLGYSSATIRAQNHRNHDGPNNLSFLSLSNSLKPQESSNTRVSFDHQPPDYNSILNPRHSLIEALPATGSQQQQYYPPLYAASNERVPQRQQIELVHQQSLPLQKSGTNFGTDKLTLSGRNQRSVPLPPNFEERTIFPVNVTAGPVKTTVQKSAMSVLSMVDEPIGFTSSPKSFSTVAPSQSSHASLPGHLARSEHNKVSIFLPIYVWLHSRLLGRISQWRCKLSGRNLAKI